ncbi:ABC transporter ATP-binding protein [Jiangella endophytica]|uniref:ABC transporter ATP-binding protein n=1 Tax=Jiangella endophytica TaxID=1623398 RepID=UPI000E351E4C|nr:ABC transporter ATP-binding protein [Jiangella endophytica]
MADDAALIDITGLTKRFGTLTAVDSLDLQVRAGEIYGLLGPNGAGKSTTIRTLMGFLRPTGGRAGLLGGTADDLTIRARVGYVGGDVVLDRGLRAGDLLRWYAGLRGGIDPARVDRLCALLSLDPTRRIGELSSGNRQKVAIVQAFMHEPGVLVLDEPTAGLDPLLQRGVLRLVRERRDAGAAVLFSSHLLPEVEDVADRVGILRAGRLVREDTIANLREIARHRLELRFATEVPSGLFDAIPGVTSAETDGRTARVVVDGSVADLMRRVAGYGVDRIVSRDEDLEDIFFAYYQDEDGGR